MARLEDRVVSVGNQKELAAFVEELANSLSTDPASWGNTSLESYLRAMAAWVNDMDGYYRNTGQNFSENQVSWKNIADMLMAATMYE